MSIVNVDPFDPKPGTANDGVSLALHERGRKGRREEDSYVLNLSVSYGFPLPAKGLRGELRVEAVNVTNQQEVMEHDELGEDRAGRRVQVERGASVVLSSASSSEAKA